MSEHRRETLEELARTFLTLPQYAREDFIQTLAASGGAAEWLPIFTQFHNDLLTKKDN
jgi:hypothetical protein